MYVKIELRSSPSIFTHPIHIQYNMSLISYRNTIMYWTFSGVLILDPIILHGMANVYKDSSITNTSSIITACIISYTFIYITIFLTPISKLVDECFTEVTPSIIASASAERLPELEDKRFDIL